VRFIYTYESGTSRNEEIRVVVGIIVHADTQWMAAAKAVNEALRRVPDKFKKNFHFHATDIAGSPKYREWAYDSRHRMMLEIMGIPSSLGMAISFGIQPRTRENKIPQLKGLPPEKVDHIQAFSGCMAMADLYVRTVGGETEVATVVAEDIEDIRKKLRDVVTDMRLAPKYFSGQYIKSSSGKIDPRFPQRAVMKIERIIDQVHFAKKDGAPLLQVADACAFAIRRYVCGQKHGADFAKAVLGNEYKNLNVELAKRDGLASVWYPQHISE
jgi:hypothetical protein